MYVIKWLNLFLVTSALALQPPLFTFFNQVEYQYEVEKWLNSIDTDLSQFNKLAGHLTWTLSTEPDAKASEQARQLSLVRNRWKNNVCESHISHEWLTHEQKRKIYLFCRGPRFTDETVLDYVQLLGQLSNEYNAKICLKGDVTTNLPDLPQTGDCMHGEPDLERLMKLTDLGPDQLKWLWTNWHDDVGSRIKPLYGRNIAILNKAAEKGGYSDIGEAWREELEMPDLEEIVFELYDQISPLYILLHAVVRHGLYKKHGPEIIDPKGPIPVHLLGNMWGQDWSPLMDLFHVSNEKIDLDERLKAKNMSVKDMVIEAEDFYTSLSLSKMTKSFWKYSLFEKGSNTSMCHGTAANLFHADDFRMLMCGETTMDDFYVIHHEMGHIEYYMAYDQQSSFFQDGANTAIHESIGDAIMHSVMVPQHLHRLNLLTDRQLLSKSTDLFLILQQALSKLPELPFALIVDKFRWDLFSGRIPLNESNRYYWYLNRKYRGIIPPENRDDETLFDAGAKFHIPDNTPFVRYFLSGIIQMQLFRSFCELAMYGKTQIEGYLPLQRCDIYGAKVVGKKLLAMMEKGSSVHWTEALRIITGKDGISTEPLLEYYKPLYKWLNDYVQLNNVHVGW